MIKTKEKPRMVDIDGVVGNTFAPIKSWPAVTTATQSTAKTIPRTATALTWEQSRKQLDNRGITPVLADDFLRGFNEGYEDEMSTSSSPSQQTTALSARERSLKELNNRGIMPITADSRSYQYTTSDETSPDPAPREDGNGPVEEEIANVVYEFEDDYEAESYLEEKERLRKAADEEQAAWMDPWNQYFQVTSLPDSPIASYIYYLRHLAQSPKQVEYEQYIADETKAENQAAQDEIRKWAEEHGVTASVASLLTSSLKGLDYINGAMETAVSGHRRPNSVPSFTETTNVIRDEVGENLAENYGEGARFVYHTAMSAADTVIAGLTGSTGGSIILGLGTASDTANEIMERGGSEEEALIGGAVSGILETVFEKFSLSELEAMKMLPVSSLKDFLGNIAKSVVTNAGEEFSTELANTLFDTIFMGELSTYALTVQGYMSQGKSEADARLLANWDLLKRLGESALSGALMGVLFGSGASANGYYRSQLAAQGDARLRSGEMPTLKQLEAMGLSEAEARGAMVLLNLEQFDDADGGRIRKSFGEGSDTVITDGSHLEDGTLKPNVTYQTGEHNYIYQTNEDGLISCVIAEDLQFKTHDGRLKHNPNTYGKLAEDHAGHLIGDQFGGSPELDNLVSQAKNVNKSEYFAIEKQWATALKKGQKVSVKININYDAGNSRPTSFIVSYEIDGAFYQKRIKN